MALFDALRHRTFRRFFVGQSVSHLGDAVFFVAMTWHALQVGEGALGVGAVLAAYMGAQLALVLFGGLIVDRYPRRRLIVVSDVLQGTLGATVALLAWNGSLTIPLMMVAGVGFGAAQSVAMPAVGAFVPEAAPKRDLGSAMSLIRGARTAGWLVGPMLGAALISWAGTAAAFATDAVTFAVSAIMLASLGNVGDAAPSEGPRHMFRDIKEGARYVRSRAWLWMSISVFGIYNFAEAGPRNVTLPVLLTEDLAGGVGAFGVAVAVFSAGAFLAMLVVGHRMPTHGRGLAAYALTATSGLMVLLLAFVPSLWMAYVLLFVHGGTQAAFGAMWDTTLGERVAPSMRGRVISLDMLGSFAFMPVSAALFGWLAGLVGVRPSFMLGGALVVAVGALGLLVPAARAYYEDDPAPGRAGEEASPETAAAPRS